MTQATKRISVFLIKWSSITAVAILVVGFVAWGIQTTEKAAKAPEPVFIEAPTFLLPNEPVLIESLPTHIIIPNLEIDVTVAAGIYNQATDSWNVSSTAAQHAIITPPINTRAGTTVIYAHNTRNLFGPLKNIQADDIVLVKTANGATFKYAYTGEQIIDPSNTAVFENAQTGAPRLALLTCSGSWNQKRQLLSFDFVSAIP